MKVSDFRLLVGQFSTYPGLIKVYELYLLRVLRVKTNLSSATKKSILSFDVLSSGFVGNFLYFIFILSEKDVRLDHNNISVDSYS